MSSYPSYTNKEISEWNTNDLSNWLLDNQFKKISELCKKNNLNGYDLFFINEEVLKTEFGINSFHERITILKTLKKLIYTHLKLNIINAKNGEKTTLILDNNFNTSLDNISKLLGKIFNINPDDIIFKDYNKHQIVSPTIKIVELMILFPKLYKCLNICDLKREEKNQKENKNTCNTINNKKHRNKNTKLNNNKRKINNKNINYIEKDFDKKDNNNNKMKNDFHILKDNIINEIINSHNNCIKDNINNEMNVQINDKINSKIKITSGSNSSSYKPSIELYINEDNFELNDESMKNNENQRYLLNKENENVDMDNKINNIKVNRNYSNNKNPIHFINLNRTKSFKKGQNNENIIYNNDMCKKYFNIHDGLSIENSDYVDKNASSNEGENKSKIYINKIIKNNIGDSEYSIKNNSFPSLSYSDKLNNNHNENDDKMNLRNLNNEILNENDTKPLNMKQSYKGPQKTRVFNEDIIGGNL